MKLTRKTFGNLSTISAGAVMIAATAALVAAVPQEYKSGKFWPEPKVIEPGETPQSPPSDAIVLFDGKSLSQWNNGEKWEIKDDVATCHGGSIETKQAFGDCQVHVEWASPAE